ncbi:hypothetical protein OROMI_004685 [Orobanche minor]
MTMVLRRPAFFRSAPALLRRWATLEAAPRTKSRSCGAKEKSNGQAASKAAPAPGADFKSGKENAATKVGPGPNARSDAGNGNGNENGHGGSSKDEGLSNGDESGGILDSHRVLMNDVPIYV